MVTDVPTGPLGGVKLVICGVTRNFLVLVRVPLLVVTVTVLVVAPVGTVAERYVVPDNVTVVALAAPNVTTEELLKFCPKMPTFAPTFPELVTNAANGGRLAFQL